MTVPVQEYSIGEEVVLWREVGSIATYKISLCVLSENSRKFSFASDSLCPIPFHSCFLFFNHRFVLVPTMTLTFTIEKTQVQIAQRMLETFHQSLLDHIVQLQQQLLASPKEAPAGRTKQREVITDELAYSRYTMCCCLSLHLSLSFCHSFNLV